MISADTHLAVHDLRLDVGARTLVDGLDLHIDTRHIIALVGPSGVGKSVLARALLGLGPGVPVRGRLVASTPGLTVDTPLPPHAPEPLRTLRGRVAVLVPQHAREALDPLLRVDRLAPPAWLRRVGLDPQLDHHHPHTLSGGSATRVCLAQGLARGAPLLLVDEPLSGLDPAAAQGIVDLLVTLRDQGHGLLWITHHEQLVRPIADRVIRLSERA